MCVGFKCNAIPELVQIWYNARPLEIYADAAPELYYASTTIIPVQLYKPKGKKIKLQSSVAGEELDIVRILCWIPGQSYLWQCNITPAQSVVSSTFTQS